MTNNIMVIKHGAFNGHATCSQCIRKTKQQGKYYCPLNFYFNSKEINKNQKACSKILLYRKHDYSKCLNTNCGQV